MRIVTVLLVLFFAAMPARAEDDPWDFERPAYQPPKRTVHIGDPVGESSNPIKQSLGLLLNVFQTFLSPLDGPKCPHYPTCSQFSREAVSMYGPGWGILMTGNRLAREYPGILENGHYPLIYKGQWRAFDPPENEWLWGEYLNSHAAH